MRGNLATHDSFLDRQLQHHILITAILAFLLPVVGALYLNPIAIILGIIALGGGARGYGIAVLVIVVVKMVITPTFWLNLAAGSQIEGAVGNRVVTFVSVLGSLTMVGLLFRRR